MNDIQTPLAAAVVRQCKKGHLIEGANARPKSGGLDQCRICYNENQKSKRQAKSEVDSLLAATSVPIPPLVFDFENFNGEMWDRRKAAWMAQWDDRLTALRTVSARYTRKLRDLKKRKADLKKISEVHAILGRLDQQFNEQNEIFEKNGKSALQDVVTKEIMSYQEKFGEWPSPEMLKAFQMDIALEQDRQAVGRPKKTPKPKFWEGEDHWEVMSQLTLTQLSIQLEEYKALKGDMADEILIEHALLILSLKAKGKTIGERAKEIEDEESKP